MTKAQHQLKEMQSAQESIKALLEQYNVDTLYTQVMKVAPSGMSRQIAIYMPYVNDQGKPAIKNLTWIVAKALDMKVGKADGISISGAGMDMGFELIYRLSSRLYGDGYKIKQTWL